MKKFTLAEIDAMLLKGSREMIEASANLRTACEAWNREMQNVLSAGFRVIEWLDRHLDDDRSKIEG